MAPIPQSQLSSHVGHSVLWIDSPLSCLRDFALAILFTMYCTSASYRPQHKVISSDMLPLTTFCSVPLPFSILLLYCFSFITLLIICNYLLLLNICDSHWMVSSMKVKNVSDLLTVARLIEGMQESLDTSMNGWIWAYLTERHLSPVAFLIAMGLDIITRQKDVRILEPLIHSANV